MNIQELTTPLVDLPNEFSARPTSQNQLGTILGVYIPCIVSIFGVVLFERLGWLVGQAGLIETIAMLLVSFLVVFSTTLSVGAISSNGRIKGGGVYYMISRTLGKEFGGGIGLVFFLANISNGATFLLGFSEGLQASFPTQLQHVHKLLGNWDTVLYASVANLVLTVISFLGADVFSKTFLVIFLALWVAVISSVTSFIARGNGATEGFTGWNMETFKENIFPHYNGYGFQDVFSIAFPAVTGILAGTNLSGDLKNPSKSIPKGTLLAILTTLLTYMSLIFLMAATTKSETLQNNYFIMQDVSWSPWLIAQGVAAATLSSALGCTLGGARILQALARDNLIPILSPFAVGSFSGDEPRRAVLLSAFLMQLIVLIGSLNKILPIVSMFYFTTYGTTNLACFALSISGAPNFRPLFKYYSRWTSLIGAILCVAGMFALQPIYAALSLLLFIIVWMFIHFRSPTQGWGDVAQPLIFHQLRKYLLRLDNRQTHIKFWRPSILLLLENPSSHIPLLDFTNDLKKGGLYILGTVVRLKSENRGSEDIMICLDIQKATWQLIKKTKIKAFCEVILARTLREGVLNLFLTAGLGPMKPNSVILGFYAKSNTSLQPASPKTFEGLVEGAIDAGPPISHEEYVSILQDALKLNKAILISRGFENLDKEQIKENFKRAKKMKDKNQDGKVYLDVWLISMYNETLVFDLPFQLALQMAYVLKCSDFWGAHAKLRVLAICDVRGAGDGESSEKENTIQKIKETIDEFMLLARIFFEVEIIIMDISANALEKERPLGSTASLDKRTGTELPLKQRNEIINSTIRKYSTFDKTAVVFIPIYEPPLLSVWELREEKSVSSFGSSSSFSRRSVSSGSNLNLGERGERNSTRVSENLGQQYVEELSILSNDLPPTLLVYGRNIVMVNEL